MDNAYALDMEAFARGEVVDNRLKMIKEIYYNYIKTQNP